jgi:membrane protein
MAHTIPSDAVPPAATSSLAAKVPDPTVSIPKNSIWKLGGLAPRLLANHVAAEIQAHDSFGRASELAFNFLFALFPLILFMLSLFGLFASRSLELQIDLLSYFADFLPASAFQLLNRTTIELAKRANGRMLTFGIVTALWFASGGVNSMIDALNDAYHVQEERSWLRVRLIALALTLSIAILLLASLLVLLASTHIVDWFGTELRLQPIVVLTWKALQWPAAIFFVLISYSLIYFFGADLKHRQWHWITPGSVFGALIWLLASFCFRVYLRFFNTYSSSYGSLGAVMILLAWLYVTGLSFLIGGEINAEIDRALFIPRSRLKQTTAPQPPAP